VLREGEREMERTGSAVNLLLKAKENFQPVSYNGLVYWIKRVIRGRRPLVVRGEDVEQALERLAGERDG